MSLSEISLDLFSQKDLWTVLQESPKDILIYGMGDGAAKLIHVLRSRGLECKDIFASDDFVRGQSFWGYQVKTFEQCRQLYGDFIVLVAFSSSRPEVIDNVERLSRICELYIPDINIYGDYTSVFDREYLISHLEDFRKVYDLLSDDPSRRFLIQLLRYKLTGSLDDLWKLDLESLDRTEQIREVGTFCDLGAYVGDTVLEWKKRCPGLHTVVAMEPDSRHFKKLSMLKDTFDNAYFVNAAAADFEGDLAFSYGKGRGSSFENKNLLEGFRSAKKKSVSCRTLDNVIKDSKVAGVDLIKYDVEGQEYSAILGSQNTIRGFRPCLIVSLYHNHADLTKLPLLVKSMVSNEAKFYLSRKNKCFPAWEVELTIIQ